MKTRNLGWEINQSSEKILLLGEEPLSISLSGRISGDGPARIYAKRNGKKLLVYEYAGLSAEVSEKLSRQRPASIGQASRIPGVTPAAISLLLVHLKKKAFKESA